MSIKLVARLWELQIPRRARDVLQVLADHANDAGVCWPDVELIGWKVDKNRRNVQRNLRELEELSLIKAIGYKSGGRGLATVYRLTLENATPKPALVRKGGASDTLLENTPETGGLTRDDALPGINSGAGDTLLGNSGAEGTNSGAGDTLSEEERAALATQKGGAGDTKGRRTRHPNHQEPSEPRARAATAPKSIVEIRNALGEELVDGVPLKPQAITQAMDRLERYRSKQGFSHPNPWPYARSIALDEHDSLVRQERAEVANRERSRRIEQCDNPECCNGYVLDDDNRAGPCPNCKAGVSEPAQQGAA